MPSDRSRDALADIRDHIHLAQGFVDGLDLPGFVADVRTRYAVLRCLEIISEASRRVEEPVRARHPAIPWREIAAAGNVYRHEYGEVRADMLGRTVKEALPPLLTSVELELAKPG